MPPKKLYRVVRARPEMRQSVVLVADILGFKERIRSAVTAEAQDGLLAELYRSLRNNRWTIAPGTWTRGIYPVDNRR
jgi:hypothetical protein